jgi:formate hydrogenlyase transcriptional activator
MIEKLRMEIEKENFLVPDINILLEEFTGKSQEFQYVLRKVSTVAPTLVPVLIEGETGVGKEVVADLIYRNSSRVGKPFIKVNCGALPKELIEDELFGHEKGAFTSAIQARKGRFELADGGTIFLDEIGELPLEMQPKLLRVLQSGQFERVGGQTTIQVDTRIIAATNRNLEKEIQQGRFREDLFYRLNVFPITVPPLRKRNEDILDLINYFVAIMSKKYGKNVLQISKANMQRLIGHHWPGNIRELRNVIERSVLESDGNTLKLDWYFNADHAEAPENKQSKSLLNLEKDYIEKILEECHWKINGESGAAEKLSMHPNTLRSKMKKLNISRPAQIERFS